MSLHDEMMASWAWFLACCQGSKPVFIPFSDSQCVFLEDSRRHCIYLKQYWKIPELSRSIKLY